MEELSAAQALEGAVVKAPTDRLTQLHHALAAEWDQLLVCELLQLCALVNDRFFLVEKHVTRVSAAG